MKGIRLALGLAVLVPVLAACNRSTETATPGKAAQVATQPAYSDQDISDAWIYVLGRLLVLRQQKLDFEEGFRWNEIVHRKPGAVDWPNPNLDVAYSEAWVAIDENSCTIAMVPKITGRYWTVQFLNGWGETLANINERTQPGKSGDFAVCLKGAVVPLPADTPRIDLPVKYSRVLIRVELGKNWDEAVKLQRLFAFRATGKPAEPTPPTFPDFDTDRLPGVALFDNVPAVLDSEADINAGMTDVAAKARAIAAGIKASPAERERVDRVIHDKAMADFAKASPNIGHGTTKNHWIRPAVSGVYGSDWLGRTLINAGGIWANTMEEVVYYKGSLDADGVQLNGTNTYTLTFPKDDLPPKYARYFWSVIAVDPQHMRVLPNLLNRFLLNKESGVKTNADGSLTLYFAPEKPGGAPDENWLPTPKGQDYRLTFRFYGPQGGVVDGTWFPPPLVKRT